MLLLTVPSGFPQFLAIVPYGMVILGILGFICQVRSWMNPSPTHPTRQEESWIGPAPIRDTYHYDSVDYTGDYVVDEGDRRPNPVNRMPPQCPSCGADITTEDVGLVGPLQARCPYCFKTIDLEERYK